MRYKARSLLAAVTNARRKLRPKPKDTGLLVVSKRKFEPSPVLVAEMDRARRLARNIERASVYSPRLQRRAIRATQLARDLTRLELAAHKENS